MINSAGLDSIAEALDEHAIVSIADAAGNITYVNQLFTDISGYDLSELLGKNHRLLKSGIHPPEFYREMWDILLDGKSWHGEICNRKKNGELYWVRATIKPVLDSNRLPIQYISIRTDITELKATEAALQQKVRLQLMLAEISRDLLSTSSAETSDAMQRALQRCGEYLNVDRAYLFLYAEYGAKMSNTHEWCADGIEPQLDVLQDLPLADLPWWREQMSKGDLLDISDVAALPAEALAEKTHFESQQISSLIAMPLQSAGKIYGFVGFDSVRSQRRWLDSDIRLLLLLTQLINSVLVRNHAEQAVEVHKERLRRGQTFANIGTWDWNIQTGELFWTERIGPLFGYKVGELETSYENFLSAIYPDDRQMVMDAIDACVAHDVPYEVEHRVVWPDGTVRWLLERGAVVRDESGNALQMLGVVQDIDDRKKAEMALLERERELSNAQAVAHLGSFNWNPVSGELHWSDEHFRLWGLTPGSIVPTFDVFRQGIHPNDLKHVEDNLQKAIQGGGRCECKYRVVWPDGSVHHIHGIGTVTYDANGKAMHMAGTVQDITEMTAAQQRMGVFQRMVESVIDGVVTIDHRGIIQSFNAAACAMFGYREADVVGCNVNILMPEPYRSEHDGYLKRYFSDKSSRIMGRQLELPGCRSDGSVFPLEISITEIGDSDETIIVGVTRDITSRKQQFQALQDAKERFSFAVEGAGDGIWDWNVLTGEMPLSGHYESMLGFDEGELEPTINGWIKSVHPDDLPRVQEALQNYMSGKISSYVVQLRLRCKNSDYLWVLCRGTIVARDDQGNPTRMIGIHSDISKSKAIEAALVDASEKAERANQAKSDFLSSMSHELRTPMNAILGFAQMLEYDSSLSADQQDNVHEILKGGRHLLELINEVLDLSKIEAGHVDLSLEPIDIGSVINECSGLISPLITQRQITLHLDLPPHAAVRADRVRFKQALLNLLSNAVKYNRDGGHIYLDVRPAAEQHLRITVTDTGAGIEQDRIGELFQPFQRLGAEYSEIEGTGIGLSITRRLVELMGGDVGVDSQVGVGSAFWIELPSDELPDSELGTKDVDGLTISHTGQYHILCIDDNPANLKLIAHMLALRQHIRLTTAHTPMLGIDLALTHQPDLILLDINMPHMDGYQVLNVLKADTGLKNIPVIAITANAMPRDVERGRLAGFSGYITKPLNLTVFLETIDSCLHDRNES